MSGMGEAVEGYVQLAQWWATTWGAHATSVATRLESGTYTAEEAMADLVACGKLAAETLFLVANEAVEAAAVMSGSAGQPQLVQSSDFETTASTSSTRTLALDGPLVALIGTDQIPVSSVTIRPSVLPPNVVTFHLDVDATGHAGVAYQGTVRSYAPNVTAAAEAITVWVSVP